MKTKLLLAAALMFTAFSFAQTVLYSEDFEGATGWTINTDLGVEGAFPNEWYISCQEDGAAVGVCGSACVLADNSLHLGSPSGLTGDLGAAYLETGAATTDTDRRAESADISTIGQTNLTLNFDMIGWGGNASDYCELFYSTDGGVVWTSLAGTLTSMCCGGIACTGVDQGLWQNNTYPLPVACENIANLRISFVWINLDDGIATDPSFAVDDIEITTPSVVGPTAAFTTANVNICVGDCIDFTDMSTVGANPNWAWTFAGADAPGTSAIQNPVGICYNTAGSYQVELTVTDDDGNDTETQVGYITVVDCSVPTSGFTPSATTICVGECLTFVDNSTGTVTTWDWTFNSADTPTANIQNPGSICWSTSGTFDVDLQVSDGTNADVSTVSITVTDPPTVSATATPGTTICAGEAVTLTGTGATTYVWDNAVVNGVAFNPTTTTTYTVTGTDAGTCAGTFMIEVIVESCDSLIADFSIISNNLCVGQCITLEDLSSGTITDWAWDFGGGATPNTSIEQSPTVCFDAPGTFNIQLTLTDALGANASTTQSVSVFASPSVNAQLDTIIDLGGEAALIANGSVPGSYSWFPTSNVDCDTCSITFASPWVNTTYTVTLSDINGCSATDTVAVYVNFIEGLGVPTAFSPNLDGNNDVLYVKGIGITALNFKVYNRYGEMVFETFEQMIGWDGTFRGKDENSGVFTWVLEYNMVNGNAGILKGNTTLIR
jgi:gliding motility-associated-like protein